MNDFVKTYFVKNDYFVKNYDFVKNDFVKTKLRLPLYVSILKK